MTTSTQVCESKTNAIVVAGILALGCFIPLLNIPAAQATAIEEEFRADLKILRKELEGVKTNLQETRKTTVPVGTILPYGGNLTEEQRRDGWLPCDGTKHQVADYPELYRVIKSAFGGDEAGTYFHLPDLLGRFARGVDHGKGRDPDAADRVESGPGPSGNTGDAVGSLQSDEFKYHAHYFDHWDTWKSGGEWTGSSYTVSDRGKKNEESPRTWGSKGGEETRPKNIYVNWIIKAKSAKTVTSGR